MIFVLENILLIIQQSMSQNCNQRIYGLFNGSIISNTTNMTGTNVAQLCWLSNENFTYLQSLNDCLGM